MATASTIEPKFYTQPQPTGTNGPRLERGVYDDSLSKHNELRLVIFGKTGTGKSSTGNTILGRKGFVKEEGMASRTRHCRKQQVKLMGRNVTIVDTPGVSDGQRDPMDTLHEISRCLLFVKPGPHALLFVVNGNARFTKEEEDAYFAIRRLFASNLPFFVIVVFTHFDAFENNKATFQQKLEQYGKEVDAAKKDNRTLSDIRKVLADVGYTRQVLFSNTGDEALKDQQVLQLLDVIQDVADENHMPYFEDKKTETAALNLEKVIQDIRKEDFQQTPAQVWEKVQRSNEVKEKKLLKALEPARDDMGCAIL